MNDDLYETDSNTSMYSKLKIKPDYFKKSNFNWTIFMRYLSIHKTPLEQWLPLLEMELGTRLQILDEAICFSLRANAFGKGMN